MKRNWAWLKGRVQAKLARFRSKPGSADQPLLSPRSPVTRTPSCPIEDVQERLGTEENAPQPRAASLSAEVLQAMEMPLGSRRSMSQASLASMASMTSNAEVKDAPLRRSSSQIEPPGPEEAADDVESMFPSDASEAFTRIGEEVVPMLNLEPLAEELLSVKWQEGSLLSDFLLARGVTELEHSSVQGKVGSDSRLVKVWKITMRMSVPPAPLCPKSTRVTTMYHVSVMPAATRKYGSVVIESSSISHDVPFGSKFLVQDRIDLLPAEDGWGIRLSQSGRIVFLQSCGVLKGTIKSGSLAGLQQSWELLKEVVRKRAENQAEGCGSKIAPGGAPPAPPVAEMITCEVRIWELQRRGSLSDSVWRAPFLLHDGAKRWRWVDEAYLRHPWTTSIHREEAALTTSPPVAPGRCWSPLGGWEVRLAGGDADGWQYNTEFHHSNWSWSRFRTARHVRRRMWKRSFVLNPPEPMNAGALLLEEPSQSAPPSGAGAPTPSIVCSPPRPSLNEQPSTSKPAASAPSTLQWASYVVKPLGELCGGSAASKTGWHRFL